MLGVDTFDTTFDFTYGYTTPPGADGFTFTLQNSLAKAMAVGFPGGSLGYQNIPNSIAIKFDIYPNVSTTGLYVGGEGPRDTPVQAVNATTPVTHGISIDLTKNPDGSTTGIDFHANPSDDYHVHLVYDGTLLTETFSDVTKNITVTQKYTVNVPAVISSHTAYAGFTASTGHPNAEQDIISWKYTGVQTSTGLVPLPAPNLFGTACQSGNTMLAWSGGTGNETGFEIDRSSDGTNFTAVNTTPTAATNYMDSGLDPTKTYSYKIKALGDATNNSDSAFSNVVMASTAGLNPPVAINHGGGFAGATDLKFNGSAKILPGTAPVPNALQLTSGLANAEDASAFDTNAQLVNQFDTSFDFTFGPTTPPIADGFTFTIQAGPPDTVGGEGGGLGYVNILNSVAVKFDIYDSGAGPTVSTTGVYVNGAAPADGNQPIDATTPAAPGNSIDLTMTAQGSATGIKFHTNFADTFRANLKYDGTTLTETVTDLTTNAVFTHGLRDQHPADRGQQLCIRGLRRRRAGERSEQDIIELELHQSLHRRHPPHLPADFNGDGQQNFADLLILAQNYNGTRRPSQWATPTATAPSTSPTS